MPFKFDSQHAFLTYAQCDTEAQELINFFINIKPVVWCRVALETHEDGNPHRHAVIKFNGRLQTRNERIFDINGYHPNIKPVRSIKAALEYCAKEQHVDHGPVPGGARDWSAIVEAAKGDELDWLRVVHEERIQQHVAVRLRALNNSTCYDVPQYDNRPIDVWLETILPQDYKSLLVVGQPGIGKTGWAMKYAPKPALLVKHIDSLKHFRINYHKSIVFDDCDFKHMPRPTQLQLCDYENPVQVHVRYGVAMIPERVPRLFLCNYGCEPFIEDIAIQGRRLQVIRQ